jgi:hypothetical protein
MLTILGPFENAGASKIKSPAKKRCCRKRTTTGLEFCRLSLIIDA